MTGRVVKHLSRNSRFPQLRCLDGISSRKLHETLLRALNAYGTHQKVVQANMSLAQVRKVDVFDKCVELLS